MGAQNGLFAKKPSIFRNNGPKLPKQNILP